MTQTKPFSAYPAKFRYQGETARGYLKKRASNRQWKQEQEVFQRVIGRIPFSSTLLDAPIGTGRFLDYYLEADHNVYGLDISKDMLALTSELQKGKKNDACLVQADTEFLPICDEAFDYVICARFLNWIPLNIFRDMLSEFQRVTRHGLIFEIRVRRSIGLIGILRSLLFETLSSPKGMLGRFIRFTQNRVNILWPQKKQRRSEQTTKANNINTQGGNEGYVVHHEDDVIQEFAAHDLIVEDVALVNEKILYTHLEIQPFFVYTLRKKPQNHAR